MLPEYLIPFVWLSSAIIGVSVGATGIGGFLLPFILWAFLHLSVRDSLAVGFTAFTAGGIIGTHFYWRNGHIDRRLTVYLSLGTLPGALLGSRLNLALPQESVKVMLAVMVLLTSLYLLWSPRPIKKAIAGEPPPKAGPATHHWLLFITGLVTGTGSSLTGVGGPLLVVPVLIAFQIPAHQAVGVALFNSLIVSTAAGLVYLSHAAVSAALVLPTTLAHAAGIALGAFISHRWSGLFLRQAIGWISLLSSLWILLQH
ncbi:MAG: sulfite exporter TauE/SafE family protein [Firmicutes bacterium]|nr:sulfite exporter TauE/SafE family protein [Bacillota bacterium]